MARVDGMADDQDFTLTVTVRLYGGGTAEEAAKALKDYPTTFDLPGDREVEILDVKAAGHERLGEITVHPDTTGQDRVRAEYGGRRTAWPVGEPITLARILAEFEDL